MHIATRFREFAKRLNGNILAITRFFRGFRNIVMTYNIHIKCLFNRLYGV